MLQALTEIHRILQIEDNISISCQTLGRSMVAVNFLSESQMIKSFPYEQPYGFVVEIVE